MGEGGVSPEYFLYKMQWWEVNRYIAGLHRRYHPTYEAARMLQWFLACMFNNKEKHAPPQSPQDLYKFGWEEDKPDTPVPEITEQDAADLQAMMDNFQWN